jgi:hypothetical protein
MTPSITLILALAGCNPPIETNTPPSIKFVSPSDDDSVNEGDTVTLEVLVRDRDGDLTSTLEVSSDLQGVLIESQEVTHGESVIVDVVFQYDADANGLQTITAVADDGRVDGERISTLAVTVNGAPSDPVISISPVDPTADNDLIGNVDQDSVDPEFPDAVGRVIHSATWTHLSATNGDDLQTEVKPPVIPAKLPASQTDKGDVWQFCVEAAETQDGVTPLESGIATTVCLTVSIGNRSPGDPTVDLVPSNPAPGDDLVCDVITDAVDPDGDDVTYQFAWALFDDTTSTFVVVNGLTGASLSATETSEGDEWQCQATATDGTDSAATFGSDEATVGPREFDVGTGSLHLSGSKGENLGQYAVGAPIQFGAAGNQVVVGHPSDDAGSNSGRVAIWQSTALSANQSPTLTITGFTDANFGSPIVAIPDVDGDGLREVASAAQGDPDNDVDPEVFLLFSEATTGSFVVTSSSDVASVVPNKPSKGHGFGSEISAGLLTGSDGLHDLVVAQVSDLRQNEVYVWDASTLVAGGTPSDSSQAAVILTAADETDTFGFSLASGVDLDGAGEDELIIGAPTNAKSNAVYIYFGGLQGTFDPEDADVIIESDVKNTELGWAVTPVLISDDGYTDLVVSGPANNSDKGAIWVFEGDAWGTGTTLSQANAIAFVSGADNKGRFGDRVVNLGDRGVDGLDEVLVGAPAADPGGLTDAGRVFLFNSGDLSGNLSSDESALVANGENEGDMLNAVGPAGDLDQDGRVDWMAGAPFNDDAGKDAGRLYIFRSSP